MVSSLKNYDLTHHNTFGLPASCDLFVEYENVEDLQGFLLNTPHFLRSKHLHIGGGSNLVFTNHFSGIVLHSAVKGKKVSEIDNNVFVKVGAGEDWDEFVAWSVDHGYYGLENLSLIPGEVGASAVQNIGAYGVEAGDFITEVEAIELETAKVKTFKSEECQYAYRHSIFKAKLHGKYAITHVTFRLSKTFHPNFSYGALQSSLEAKGITSPTAQDLRKLIIDIRNEKLPHPSTLGSAGSFFMNPIVSEALFKKLKEAHPALPFYPTTDGVKIPAGWLIEQCGWKGRRVGNVGVYEKQALVLVNHGGANGTEVKHLAQRIVSDVKEKFNIELQPEANFI